MLESVNEVIKINDRVYRITEVCSIHRYLILGDSSAVLLDTGYGFVDFIPQIKEITNLPFKVINTHGHADHAFGDYLFREVFLHQEDIKLLQELYCKQKKIDAYQYRVKKNFELASLMDINEYCKTNLDNTTFLPIKEGDEIKLGGITLQVIELPGHTRGSIALYSPQLKSLFAGDSVSNKPIWYVSPFNQSLPLSTFVSSLQKLKHLDLNIEYIYSGHGNVPFSMALIDDIIACIEDLALNNADDSLVSNSGMQGYQHSYHGASIIYSKEHLLNLQKHIKERKSYIET